MGYKLTTKVEGKEVTLNLSDEELHSVMSVMERNSAEKVHLMKKGKSAPMIFLNERTALACQERHNFEYMFIVKKEAITPAWKKQKEAILAKNHAKN